MRKILPARTQHTWIPLTVAALPLFVCGMHIIIWPGVYGQEMSRGEEAAVKDSRTVDTFDIHCPHDEGSGSGVYNITWYGVSGRALGHGPTLSLGAEFCIAPSFRCQVTLATGVRVPYDVNISFAPPSRVTTEPSRLPVAIVTTNFTFMAFISNMTLGTHSIRLSDKSGMLIPSARYSLQSRPRVYAGTCGVQVAISIFNVQQSDIRQYWLSVQQAPNPPTLLELPKLSVITCDKGDIPTAAGCERMETTTPPHQPPPCGIDGTGQCIQSARCLTEVDSVWAITWPTTPPGETASVPCPASQHGTASRHCSIAAVWRIPDLTQCGSSLLQQFAVMVDRTPSLGLNGTGDRPQDPEEVLADTASAVEQLSRITNDIDLFPGDLLTSLDLLTMFQSQRRSVFDLRSRMPSDTYQQGFVLTVSNLVTNGTRRSWGNLRDRTRSPAQELCSAGQCSTSLQPIGAPQPQLTESGQLLRLVEDFTALESAQLTSMPEMEYRSTVTSPNLQLQFVSLPRPEASLVALNTLDSEMSDEVILPQELFEQTNSGQYGVVSFTGIGELLESPNFPLPGVSVLPSSKLLTVVVVNAEGVAMPVQDLSTPVTLVFRHLPFNTAPANLTCAFYDYGLVGNGTNRIGGWNATGLVRNSSASDEVNTGTTVCYSTHLTSFSVLFTLQANTVQAEEALSFISFIGSGVSLVCLTLTVIILVSLRELRTYHNAVNCNLALSLAVGQILFLAGIERTENEGVCTAFAIGLQYAFLAAFMWMLMEGIQIYGMMVQVFASKQLKTFYLAAYGIPVIIIGISVGIRIEDYGTDRYCWIDVSSATHWSFAGPIAAIVLINTIILSVVIRALYLRTKAKGDKSRYKAAVSSFKATLILLPLLGTMWIFGLLAVNDNTIIFHYLFAIFNSLQGVFIFVLHVLRNDKVWRAVRSHVGRRRFLKTIRRLSGSDKAQATTSGDCNSGRKYKRGQESSSSLGRSSTVATEVGSSGLERSSTLSSAVECPVAGSVATTVPTPEVNVQLKEGDVSCDCPSSGSPLATSGDSLATSGGPLVTRQCSKPQTKAEEVTMRLVSSSPESESSSSGNETLDVGKCAG